MREGDEHAIAGADECAQLVLGLGDAERGQRRWLGLELVRLAERQLLQRSGRLDQASTSLGRT